ncbi:MAG: GWxTD domain-containing protein [Acidobacteriota bacterium]
MSRFKPLSHTLPLKTRLLAGLLLGLALVPAFPASAQKFKQYDRLDVTNLLLSPEYSQWLVGPIAYIASEAERSEYLGLADDAAAQEFVDSFWQKRPEVKKLFDRRAEQADKRFTEGTFVGSRTDRGTIFILYGDPESSEYEEHRNIEDPDVERWVYLKSAEKGLDGKKPRRQYRFAKEGDVTEFFVNTGVDQRRRQLEQRLEPTRTRRPF